MTEYPNSRLYLPPLCSGWQAQAGYTPIPGLVPGSPSKHCLFPRIPFGDPGTGAGDYGLLFGLWILCHKLALSAGFCGLAPKPACSAS